MKQAIQSIISDYLLPDLDLLRDRDRRGGGLRDRLGERDRDRPTKIQNKCLLQYYGKNLPLPVSQSSRTTNFKVTARPFISRPSSSSTALSAS